MQLKRANKPFFAYLRRNTKLNVTFTKLRKADGSDSGYWMLKTLIVNCPSSFFGSVFCEETVVNNKT